MEGLAEPEPRREDLGVAHLVELLVVGERVDVGGFEVEEAVDEQLQLAPGDVEADEDVGGGHGVSPRSKAILAALRLG